MTLSTPKFVFYALVIYWALCLHPASSSAKDRVIFSTVRGFYNTALAELAQQYMELHPEVEIEINIQPDNFSILRYYTAQMAADRRTAPDIVHGNLIGIEENFHQGNFLAINEYLERPNPYADGAIWRTLFDETFLKVFAVNGIYYCVLPLDYLDVAVYYNRDIFARLGLSPPQSWEEWLEHCAFIESQGLIAISIAATMQANVSEWFSTMLEDAALRHFVPLVIARPGDWNWVEDNASYVHDLNDRYADQMITINPERLTNAFLDGKISYEMPLFVEAYSAFQTLTRHYELGHLGTDQAGAYNLFLTQKAAMWMIGSWRVGSLMKDLADLPEELRFDWSVFPTPSIKQSTQGLGPLRGLGGAGHQMCIVDKKDPAHHDRVVDFMMYLYAPAQSAYLIRRTLEMGEFIQGAPLIKGAREQLPTDIRDRLDQFGGQGYCKQELIPIRGDNQTKAYLRPWTQLFSLGRISPEEYLARKQVLVLQTLHRQVRERGYDLDPTTEDPVP